MDLLSCVELDESSKSYLKLEDIQVILLPASEINKAYLNGKKIGVVTSGSISPTLNVNIGLGYIDEPLKIDDEIQIMIRGKLYSAKIVKRPFVEKVNKITR